MATWDPDAAPDAAPSAFALRRLRSELRELLSSPLPGICVVPDEDKALRMHCLLQGPGDTPYEGGLFYFILQLPPTYPDEPPRAKLMTTGGGSVRFNPNLYANGKVCLSILGTWAGPGWSQALTLSAVLLSIQSLMGPSPLCNEPGLEGVVDAARLAAYNDAVTHETMRVAVIDQLTRPAGMPAALLEAATIAFAEARDVYRAIAARHRHLDGGRLNDTLQGQNKGTFVFSEMAARIEQMQACVEEGRPIV